MCRLQYYLPQNLVPGLPAADIINNVAAGARGPGAMRGERQGRVIVPLRVFVVELQASEADCS